MAGNSPNDLRQEREPANMFSKVTRALNCLMYSLNQRKEVMIGEPRPTNGFTSEDCFNIDFLPIVYVKTR